MSREDNQPVVNTGDKFHQALDHLCCAYKINPFDDDVRDIMKQYKNIKDALLTYHKANRIHNDAEWELFDQAEKALGIKEEE